MPSALQTRAARHLVNNVSEERPAGRANPCECACQTPQGGEHEAKCRCDCPLCKPDDEEVPF